MILSDVNILVYAHREVAPDHERYKAWLGEALNGPEAYGVADIVLSGFLRIVTMPRVFDPPQYHGRGVGVRGSSAGSTQLRHRGARAAALAGIHQPLPRRRSTREPRA